MAPRKGELPGSLEVLADGGFRPPDTGAGLGVNDGGFNPTDVEGALTVTWGGV